MSNTIDERIVEMQFNNGEFEKGIQESLKSLDALKKGLELDKSAKSLDSLSKVISNVDFSAMAKGIETISSRFTTMGMIGMRVIQNITDKVLGMSERMIKSVTVDQITAGFSKYAQKTEAVQTIMSATGKTVEEVEEVLSRLNDYTDWTSFNFAEMTTTIGKFTSSGVDLETAERAMEGIGNEASLAGATIQNANHAMYNFAQALATGKVQLMDWKSIENANMATKQFKEEIINTAIELGTLKKVEDGVGKTTKGTQVDFAKFNATLSEGWFTSDVLIKTLEKYADTSTELGQKAFDAAKKAITFGQAIDSVKDAVSTGWMNTFQLVFGNFEEASELWTGFADGLIEVLDIFSSARNELLSGWRDLNGEDGRQILLDGLVEIYQVLSDIFTMVGNVVREFFPPITSEHLMAISKGVKEFADNLHEAVHLTEVLIGGGSSLFSAGGPEINLKGNIVEKLEELHGLLKRGSTGDEVKKLQERLIELGYLDEKGADGIFGPKTQEALKKFQEAAGVAVDGIYGEKSHEALGKALGKGAEEAAEPLEKVENYVYHLTEGLTTLQRIARGFFAVVHIGANVGGFIINVVKSVISLLKPLGNVILTIAAVIGDCLVGFDKWITQSGFFQSALKGVQSFLEPVGKWISKVSDSIVKFLTTGPKIQSFTDLWNRLKDGLMGTEFGKSLSQAFARIQKTKFFEIFTKFVTGVKDKVKAFVTYLKFMFRWIKMGRKPFGAFGKVVDWFRVVIDKLKETFSNLPNKLVDFGEAIYSFASNLVEAAKQNPVIQGFINKAKGWFSVLKTGVGSFVERVPGYVSKMGSFFKGLVSGDINIGSALGGVANTIDEYITGLCNQLDASGKLESAWNGTKAFFSKLVSDLREFAELVREAIVGFFSGENGSGGGNGSTSLFTATDGSPGEGSSQKTIFDQLSERLSSFDKVVDWVKSKWEAAKEKVQELFTSIKEFFVGSGNGGGFSFDFESISKGFWNAMHALDTFIGDFWHNMETMAPNLVNIIKAITGLFIANKVGGAIKDVASIVKNFSQKYRKDVQPVALSILEIAGAIALIAYAIYKLGSLEIGKLVQGGVAIVVIAGVLLGFMALSKKIGNSGEEIGKLGRGMLELAGAIAILSVLAWALQLLHWDVLWNGLGKMAVLMGTLAAFILAIQGINKLTGQKGLEMVGLLGAVGAVAALAALAWALQLLHWDVLWNGLGKMAVLMGALAVFILAIQGIQRLMGPINIKFWSLIGLVAAIGALAYIAHLLSGLNANKFYRGVARMAAIAGVLIVLIAAISAINKYLGGGAKSVVGVIGIAAAVAAIWVLSKIVESLGNLDPAVAKQGLIALGVITACLTVLSVIVGVLGSLGLGTVLQGALGLVAVAAALGLALAILSAIATGSMENIGAALFVLGSGLQDYNGFISDIVWDNMYASLEFLKSFAESMGILMASPAGDNEATTITNNLYRMGGAIGAYGRNVSKLTKEALDLGRQVADDMKYIYDQVKVVGDGQDVALTIGTIGGAISLYYQDLEGIDTSSGSNAISNMKTIFGELSSAVPDEADLAAIEGFAGNDEGSALTLFSIGVTNVATALENYGKIAEKAPLDKINASTDVLERFVALSATLAGVNAVTSLLTGQSDVLAGFALDVELLGGALSAYATSIGGNENYDAHTMEESQIILERFAALQNTLPQVGGIVDFIKGKKSLGTFASSMSALGKGLANYATAVASVTSWDNVDKSAAPIEALANAQNTLSSTGGLWGLLAGATDLSGFASALPQLGEGLAGYADALSGKTFGEDIVSSTGVIQALADIQSSLPDTGGWVDFLTGSQNLGDLGQGLEDFTSHLSTAEANLGSYTGDHMKSAVETLREVAGIGMLLYRNSFAYNLSAMADEIGDFYRRMTTEVNVDTAGQDMLDTLNSIVSGIPTTVEDASGNLAAFGDGIVAAISNGMMASESFDAGALAETLGGSLKGALESYYSSFSTIGKHLATGLAAGIRLGKSAVVSAAAAIMAAALAALRAAGQIKSPSRVTQGYGRYLDEGLALGLNKYSSVAEIAAEGVMDSTLSSIGTTIGKISTAIQNGIDTTPVITPVLDLSNLSSGFGVVNGMFGQVALAERSTFGGLSRLSFAAGGNADVVAAIYDLNNRLDDVTEAITNMKVVTDTGALVGQISSQMDKALGAREVQKRRLG